jgi:L-threonylcarbamoyladenylate synthase
MTERSEVVTIAAEPAAGAVDAAAAALRDGGVVVVPTDTVYGLAALPADGEAMARLFALKGRSAALPVAVLCASADQALGLADPSALTGAVRRIADRLWPGPLTLVVPRRPGLGYHLGEPGITIGVRCPDHPLVRAVAGEVGPLATTSANRHGEPTPATAAAVAAALGDGLALVVDGGPCRAPASSVVDATGRDWTMLREGGVPLAAVRAAARGAEP